MCYTSQPCRWIFLRRQQIVKIKFPFSFRSHPISDLQAGPPSAPHFLLETGFLKYGFSQAHAGTTDLPQEFLLLSALFFFNLSYNILRSHYFLCSFSFPWEPSTCLSSPSHWFGSKLSWLEGWMNGWMDESQSDLKSIWWVPLYVDSPFLLKIHF